MAMILGNQDPLCSVPMLYDFLKDLTQRPIPTAIIGGDHSWDLTDTTDPASLKRNADNIAAGVAMAAHWIDIFLAR